MHLAKANKIDVGKKIRGGEKGPFKSGSLAQSTLKKKISGTSYFEGGESMGHHRTWLGWTVKNIAAPSRTKHHGAHCNARGITVAARGGHETHCNKIGGEPLKILNMFQSKRFFCLESSKVKGKKRKIHPKFLNSKKKERETGRSFGAKGQSE